MEPVLRMAAILASFAVVGTATAAAQVPPGSDPAPHLEAEALKARGLELATTSITTRRSPHSARRSPPIRLTPPPIGSPPRRCGSARSSSRERSPPTTTSARRDPTSPARPSRRTSTAAFHAHIDRALALAEQRLRDRPNDADAHFQLGAAYGYPDDLHGDRRRTACSAGSARRAVPTTNTSARWSSIPAAKTPD